MIKSDLKILLHFNNLSVQEANFVTPRPGNWIFNSSDQTKWKINLSNFIIDLTWVMTSKEYKYENYKSKITIKQIE